MMLVAAAIIGVITGLIPGLHVNLLAAVALTIPGMEPWSDALIVIGVVHTFVTILPTTYIGAPDADSPMAVLPAHRMLLAGDGALAVRLSLQSSMVAAIMAVAWLVPYHWVLTRPRTIVAIDAMAPFVLLAIPILLAARARSPWAWAVTLLAAGLGWVAFDWPIHAWLPGSALLPLLSGLFGIPTLLAARRHIPWQRPAHDPPLEGRATIGGVLASAVTAVLPGVTAAVATAFAVRGDERKVLAAMSAVNTAHLIFALSILWILGKTRSGLAIAWSTWSHASPWLVVPPPDLVQMMGLVLLSGAAAVVATLSLERRYRRVLQRLAPGVGEKAALAIIVALTAITTGWTGLLLLAAATVVGRLPLQVGIARVHLAACLTVPIAFRLL